MLSGRTVLIVEAQYLIALDLQNTLEDHFNVGKTVIARTADDGDVTGLSLDNFQLALVEVERDLGSHITLVGELKRNGVPVIAVTADADLHGSLNWFPETPILLKPLPSEQLLKAISDLLTAQKE